MKVIEGHLTATDKKAIQAILNSGAGAGQVGKASFHITSENGVYTVIKSVMDRGLIPVPGSARRLSRYTSKFTK